MSNFIVSGGLGAPLMVTFGWGSGLAIPAGKSILHFQQGGLLIDIEAFGGDIYLQFEDGVHSIYQQLPFTADQLAGIDWALIKIVRHGSDLIIVQDKTTVATIALTQVINYGGVVKIMELNSDKLFDLRVVEGVISKEASDYYYDDIYENGGDSVLPNSGN